MKKLLIVLFAVLLVGCATERQLFVNYSCWNKAGTAFKSGHIVLGGVPAIQEGEDLDNLVDTMKGIIYFDKEKNEPCENLVINQWQRLE